MRSARLAQAMRRTRLVSEEEREQWLGEKLAQDSKSSIGRIQRQMRLVVGFETQLGHGFRRLEGSYYPGRPVSSSKFTAGFTRATICNSQDRPSNSPLSAGLRRRSADKGSQTSLASPG